MKPHINDAVGNNAAAVAAIQRVTIRDDFLDGVDNFRQRIVEETRTTDTVLDVGKSMRGHYEQLNCAAKETLDINNFGDYPDVIGDLCADIGPDYHAKYDRIIALAILEHVYDPFAAVANLFTMIKPGGSVYIYVPWMYPYHAPDDLKFQDYFRYSKDAIAWMLRDFESVTLFPKRGRVTSGLLLAVGSKFGLNKIIDGNKLLDGLSKPPTNRKQASGYYITAKRPTY